MTHDKKRSPSLFASSTYYRYTSSTTTLKDSYEYVIVERRFPSPSSDTATNTNGVGIIQLHRPRALNALCDDLFDDLIHAATALNEDDDVGCLVVTGSSNNKVFAAGADISEMSSKSFVEVYQSNMFAQWQEIGNTLPKPIIAAVNGFALGGGCELALMCDIILAGDNAQFGQPEINLGIIPGAGGTQRLTKAVGKSKAMHMCLTGDRMSADEALQSGLVAKVFKKEELLEEAIQMGFTIASKSRVSVQMIKETINAVDDLSGLQEGLRFERRLFHSLFATEDQKEGMAAFLEKRTPNFTHK